jgi:probable HAF family extracellular repeat protein
MGLWKIFDSRRITRFRRPGRESRTRRLTRRLLHLEGMEDRTLLASFQGLGLLPGGSLSEASGVSADGSVVVGWDVTSSNVEEAFRWTAGGGMAGLGFLPGCSYSWATGVSADGSVVVGDSGTSWGAEEAFRWTAEGGMVHLPDGSGPSYALGVSADGSVVVGYDSPSNFSCEAFRWTAEGGMVYLPGDSLADGVSADGSVVVGFDSPSNFSCEAFRWTAEGGMVYLPGDSLAVDVSADGSVVVGASVTSSVDEEAFRWTAEGGMAGLGFLPGGNYSYATGVSADGSVVVGDTSSGPFIWDAAHGMRDLGSVLTQEGVNLAGWSLDCAVGISADGSTVFGFGTGSTGQWEAWIAHLGQPATTTTVSSDTNPSVFGQSVTFTATVAADSPGGGTPTGTVTFYDNGVPIGTGELSVVSGQDQATFTTNTLTTASHSITAAYTSGDTNFNASPASAPIIEVVNQAATTTTITSGTDPTHSGQSVTFTATVTATAPGGGTPTGSVQFLIDGTNYGVLVPLSGGTASISDTALNVAGSPHSVTAVYTNVDGNYTGSTGVLTGGQPVNQAATTTTLTSDTDPSVSRRSVTFTATVAADAPGGGTRTGTGTFYDGEMELGTLDLDANGQASLSSAILVAGTHTIAVDYNGDGDGNFAGGPSVVLSQDVKAEMTTSLTSDPNASVFGQSVTVTATVSAASGDGTPLGLVTVSDEGEKGGKSNYYRKWNIS